MIQRIAPKLTRRTLGFLPRSVGASLVLLVALLLIPAAEAQTSRFVSPGGTDSESECTDAADPCGSIRAALTVASDGDTLSLSVGVYYESDLSIEKDVVIVGAGRGETVIDGDGREGSRSAYLQAVKAHLDVAAEEAVITVGKSGQPALRPQQVQAIFEAAHSTWYEGETEGGSLLYVGSGITAELRALTIRDGGSLRSHESTGGIVNDGTLRVVDSDVEHNIAFQGDLNRPGEFGRGGGIRNSGSLVVENVLIRGNVAIGAAVEGGRGGGIYNDGMLSISKSTVAENETWDVQDFCEGGGIWNGGSAIVLDSRITENESDCFEGGAGGGVFNGGTLTVEGTVIGGNSAVSQWEYTAGFGGGIATMNSITLINSTVSRNISGFGGGVYVTGSADIFSATIVENDAVDREYVEGRGGGLDATGLLTIWSTILAGNRSGDDASAAEADCALQGSVESAFLLTGAATGCPTSSLTVLPGTELAEVVRSTESEYIYVPSDASPVVDAGECAGPGGKALSEDQRGETRPFDDADVENASDGCDIGAVERQEPANQQSSGAPVASETGEVPSAMKLHQNYPNPFNGLTKIGFNVPHSAQATLVVYDVTGREVARLVDGAVAPGRHDVHWDAGDLSSGAYLYRLTADGVTQVRRMLYVK